VTERRGYVVLGTPRCGTSHLCSLLAGTGVLGRPREYLNPERRHLVTGKMAAAPGNLWESICLTSLTSNRVWALKTFHEQLVDSDVWRHVVSSNIVFVSRNDKLGQAISLARARQTDQWDSTRPPRAAPFYDAREIDRALYDILWQEATLRQMLAQAGTRVLWLIYEDYCLRPDGALSAIAEFVAVTERLNEQRATLTIQRDQLSEDWRRRYLDDRANFADFPLFDPGDRWSRLGRRLRKAKRSLPLIRKW
jgi:LPS sulfotransferase NodH